MSTPHTPRFKWIIASCLQPGDTILLQKDPVRLMPITSLRVEGDNVIISNPITKPIGDQSIGEVHANRQMKIPIVC
jgi:hypothetical protein